MQPGDLWEDDLTAAGALPCTQLPNTTAQQSKTHKCICYQEHLGSGQMETFRVPNQAACGRQRRNPSLSQVPVAALGSALGCSQGGQCLHRPPHQNPHSPFDKAVGCPPGFSSREVLGFFDPDLELTAFPCFAWEKHNTARINQP